MTVEEEGTGRQHPQNIILLWVLWKVQYMYIPSSSFKEDLHSIGRYSSRSSDENLVFCLSSTFAVDPLRLRKQFYKSLLKRMRKEEKGEERRGEERRGEGRAGQGRVKEGRGGEGGEGVYSSDDMCISLMASITCESFQV